MTLDDIDVKELTPMMKHWYSVKQKYPDHIIAYRMGDFFEFFYDDAVKISKLIGLTLTKRKVGSSNYPLAGIPHHSVTNHFNNLLSQNETIVIVDQLEDPSEVKGRIVKRGVTRVLSPGTIVDVELLKSNENNYIASLVKSRKGYGISFAELSTGEFVATEFSSKNSDPLEKLLSIFSQYDPVELIVPSEIKNDERLFLHLTDLTEAIIKTFDDYYFNHEEAYTLILRHFDIANLKGFGLEGHNLAIQAAGGLLGFLKETQRDVLPNIFKINLIQEQNKLHLDYITQRNLELVKNLWEKGKDTSLYSIFNQTNTPMGARLLKKIILQPLTDRHEINQRLNIVDKFKTDVFLRSDLREELKVVGDLERYINRVNYESRANARDLRNIKSSLEIIPKIKELLKKTEIPEINNFMNKISSFDKIRNLIEVSIKDEPPTTITEGDIIKDGYDKEVDELRDVLHNGKKYLLEYENEQKSLLDVSSGLKISHNNVLGYYIQITKNTLKGIDQLPEEYVERQTLKSSRRYTTDRLKELEIKIVSAEEEIFNVEYEIFNSIREKVAGITEDVLETANNIAMIDVLTCFAEIAEKYNYCRPQIQKGKEIVIKEGRHPVIEQLNLTEKFIPNDCYLAPDKEQILIITGPNMAGKSTYLRQIALICIIAQMGSFVPAKSAQLGVIDQVFTRIGASDDLARRLSTFMIEMTETAKILNYATPQSLIIIDELGRGTSTSDGQSIAMATLEKIHELKTKTLFSTHYHQLTEIKLPRVKNYHLDIIENDDGSINFVRKLRNGSTDKSYGIHVAKLAGIPDDVIMRAFQILEKIEEKDPFKATVKENGNGNVSGKYLNEMLKNKKKQIEHLTEKLNEKKSSINECDEDLKEKSNQLEYLTQKIEKLKNEQKKLGKKSQKKKESLNTKKKKYVQTSFFKPVVKKETAVDENVKEVLEIIRKADVNTLTPVEAMKLFLKLREKAEKL